MKKNATRGLRAIPPPRVIQAEIDRIDHRSKYIRTFYSTFCSMLLFIAAIVLVFTLALPMIKTHGDSMAPTLEDGQIVCVLRTANVEPGDLICFYYNNKVLIKRVIAVGGNSVDIDWHGNVSVDGTAVEEVYLEEKSYGDCNVSLPYKVPIGKVFVMGDNRATSVDSRHTEVGCISQEQIIGKLILRVWPLNAISAVK